MSNYLLEMVQILLDMYRFEILSNGMGIECLVLSAFFVSTAAAEKISDRRGGVSVSFQRHFTSCCMLVLRIITNLGFQKTSPVNNDDEVCFH